MAVSSVPTGTAPSAGCITTAGLQALQQEGSCSPVTPPKNCTNTPKSAVPVTTPWLRPPGTASCMVKGVGDGQMRLRYNPMHSRACAGCGHICVQTSTARAGQAQTHQCIPETCTQTPTCRHVMCDSLEPTTEGLSVSVTFLEAAGRGRVRLALAGALPMRAGKSGESTAPVGMTAGNCIPPADMELPASISLPCSLASCSP